MARRLAERGAGVVYTRDWVADLMLDLVGYTADKDLGGETIVEPGCGDGAILRRIIVRLIRSATSRGRAFSSLGESIRAYETDGPAASRARVMVIEMLAEAKVPNQIAQELASAWVIERDFLLGSIGPQVRWVVGNPPYVRVEETSPAIYTQYRQQWPTMAGRADVYIGFFEAALSLLKKGGQLCFICADRWMHNQYGARLRKHVIEDFALRVVLEMHESEVFDVPVAAYPAITVIENAPHTETVLAKTDARFEVDGAGQFVSWLKSDARGDHVDVTFSASVLSGKFGANSSWPSGPPERLKLIADLESRLPSLTEVGVSVGVGMATGADRIYVVSDPVGVEHQFIKKAIGPADLQDGVVVWTGRYLISPWDGHQLADIGRYSGLRQYLGSHRPALEARYVGRRNPDTWWRTIDRPPCDMYTTPKLVVADIHDRIEPVLDLEGHWPLHSAYYITSSDWNLEALGGYLISDIAGAFVEAYSVKMANGHLRISGQYLKKIRLPRFDQVDKLARLKLASAFRARDRVAATEVVSKLLVSLVE